MQFLSLAAKMAAGRGREILEILPGERDKKTGLYAKSTVLDGKKEKKKEILAPGGPQAGNMLIRLPGPQPAARQAKIDYKRVCTRVAFEIGSEFNRNTLDDSVPIADCQMWETAVTEWLACSPPTNVNRVQSPSGSLPFFCVWESCWTIPLVRDLPFPPPFHSTAPHSPQLTSSALKNSLFREVQISSLTLIMCLVTDVTVGHQVPDGQLAVDMLCHVPFKGRVLETTDSPRPDQVTGCPFRVWPPSLPPYKYLTPKQKKKSRIFVPTRRETIFACSVRRLPNGVPTCCWPVTPFWWCKLLDFAVYVAVSPLYPQHSVTDSHLIHKRAWHDVRFSGVTDLLQDYEPAVNTQDFVTRYDGNTARHARRSDEAQGVRVSVVRIAPSLLDLERTDQEMGITDQCQGSATQVTNISDPGARRAGHGSTPSPLPNPQAYCNTDLQHHAQQTTVAKCYWLFSQQASIPSPPLSPPILNLSYATIFVFPQEEDITLFRKRLVCTRFQLQMIYRSERPAQTLHHRFLFPATYLLYIDNYTRFERNFQIRSNVIFQHAPEYRLRQKKSIGIRFVPSPRKCAVFLFELRELADDRSCLHHFVLRDFSILDALSRNMSTTQMWAYPFSEWSREGLATHDISDWLLHHEKGSLLAGLPVGE
ncbi:hypothetical protein PR048_014390 [Dryococelus australis]|uniref:Uncharacterized protein n=1 Tax=Dryococelus australis TaxID=614101 RepID=A0ABQ9HEA1_9NEOP|nr:hypothetical protein PR048_014390 [Dryococelus australis]